MWPLPKSFKGFVVSPTSVDEARVAMIGNRKIVAGLFDDRSNLRINEVADVGEKVMLDLIVEAAHVPAHQCIPR